MSGEATVGQACERSIPHHQPASAGEIVSTMCSRLHCEVTVADRALTLVDQITAEGTVSARREALGERP